MAEGRYGSQKKQGQGQVRDPERDRRLRQNRSDSSRGVRAEDDEDWRRQRRMEDQGGRRDDETRYREGGARYGESRQPLRSRYEDEDEEDRRHRQASRSYYEEDEDDRGRESREGGRRSEDEAREGRFVSPRQSVRGRSDDYEDDDIRRSRRASRSRYEEDEYESDHSQGLERDRHLRENREGGRRSTEDDYPRSREGRFVPAPQSRRSRYDEDEDEDDRRRARRSRYEDDEGEGYGGPAAARDSERERQLRESREGSRRSYDEGQPRNREGRFVPSRQVSSRARYEEDAEADGRRSDRSNRGYYADEDDDGRRPGRVRDPERDQRLRQNREGGRRAFDEEHPRSSTGRFIPTRARNRSERDEGGGD